MQLFGLRFATANLLHSLPVAVSIVTIMLTTSLGFIAAVLTTSSFLPQAIKTIRTKDTSGISLFMYTLFSVGTLFWLLYGVFSHNTPVTIANAVTLVFAIIVLINKLRYG